MRYATRSGGQGQLWPMVVAGWSLAYAGWRSLVAHCTTHPTHHAPRTHTTHTHITRNTSQAGMGKGEYSGLAANLRALCVFVAPFFYGRWGTVVGDQWPTSAPPVHHHQCGSRAPFPTFFLRLSMPHFLPHLLSHEVEIGTALPASCKHSSSRHQLSVSVRCSLHLTSLSQAGCTAWALTRAARGCRTSEPRRRWRWRSSCTNCCAARCDGTLRASQRASQNRRCAKPRGGGTPASHVAVHGAAVHHQQQVNKSASRPLPLD